MDNQELHSDEEDKANAADPLLKNNHDQSEAIDNKKD